MTFPVILGTSNNNKIKEFEFLNKHFGCVFDFIKLEQLPFCDEPFDTFIENALAKCRVHHLPDGVPVLTDDSGLCVPSLNKEPGVKSAHYSNQRDSKLNNAKLLSKLDGVSDRLAYYYCTLILSYSNDPHPVIGQGVLHGEIVDNPIGNNGFGYDPYVFLKDYGKTVAELSFIEKNLLSHRHQAFLGLINNMRNLYL